MKVVVNRGWEFCRLSHEAIQELINLGWTVGRINEMEECEESKKHLDLIEMRDAEIILNFLRHDIRSPKFRSNELVVKVFEKLGNKAIGDEKDANIEIIEIPDDIEWYIEEGHHGGRETIHEKHRVW